MNDNKKVTIGACVMVHNMAPLINSCIKSLHWTDGIFIFDDHSTDGSLEIAQKYSNVPIKFEVSSMNNLAFQKGEAETRNYIIDRAFQEFNANIMVIVDADELLSSLIKPKIIELCDDDSSDSIAFSTWHLYDEQKYLHFWETKINKIDMVDPHTRVIKLGKHFTPLFDDGSHPILEATPATKCFHGPYHFHLKYYNRSTFPNYSIYFLPERPTASDVTPYLRKLPFELPKDIAAALSIIDWDKMPYYKETPHHMLQRVKLSNPNEALIHPKDKKTYEQT
jgi:glycosyltransferase involved in cell wall biosynthesis